MQAATSYIEDQDMNICLIQTTEAESNIHQG